MSSPNRITAALMAVRDSLDYVGGQPWEAPLHRVATALLGSIDEDDPKAERVTFHRDFLPGTTKPATSWYECRITDHYMRPETYEHAVFVRLRP